MVAACNSTASKGISGNESLFPNSSCCSFSFGLFSVMIRTEGVNQMHHSTSSRSPLRHFLGFVLTLLILCIAVLGAFTIYELSRMDRDTRGDLHPGALDSFRSTGESIDWGLDSISGIKSRKVINILLIGQDRREGQESQMRSDSMILCSVQKKSGTIRLTSLMRDMFLPVAGGRYGPLNLTYYAGGMELLDDTIRQDFGVTVDANMEVDFFRFIALIDRLGGLDLELTQEEADWLNGTTGDYWQSQWNADAGISNAGWNLHAGWNSMTAEQVTDYCRLRVVGKSDWERTERQRTVIMEILRKVRLQSPLDQIRFLHSAMPLIRTDLGIGTLFRLGMAAVFHRFDTFENNRIPVADAYRSTNVYSSDYGNLNLLIPDLPKNAEALQNSIYG